MKKLLIIALFALVACRQEGNENLAIQQEEIIDLNVPSYFPAYTIPQENQLTASRIELGKKLFNEKLLSIDSTISCGSCHKQEFGMADDFKLSPGVFNRTGTRNTPTVYNMVFSPYFFAEGGVHTLEMQALAPIGNPDEMDVSIAEVVERLKQIPSYQTLSQKAYQQSMSSFVITRAIAAYERSLISVNAKYDQFIQGKVEFTVEELRGLELFESDSLSCASCHEPPLFTNFGFYNIGLYEQYTDQGYERLTHNSLDNGKFKTPSLRNIELTAPYMHDGSLASLEHVIEHFDNGGEEHENKDTLVKGFTLNNQDRDALIAFLKTLTDNEIN